MRPALPSSSPAQATAGCARAHGCASLWVSSVEQPCPASPEHREALVPAKADRALHLSAPTPEPAPPGLRRATHPGAPLLFPFLLGLSFASSPSVPSPSHSVAGEQPCSCPLRAVTLAEHLAPFKLARPSFPLAAPCAPAYATAKSRLRSPAVRARRLVARRQAIPQLRRSGKATPPQPAPCHNSPRPEPPASLLLARRRVHPSPSARLAPRPSPLPWLLRRRNHPVHPSRACREEKATERRENRRVDPTRMSTCTFQCTRLPR